MLIWPQDYLESMNLNCNIADHKLLLIFSRLQGLASDCVDIWSKLPVANMEIDHRPQAVCANSLIGLKTIKNTLARQ